MDTTTREARPRRGRVRSTVVVVVLTVAFLAAAVAVRSFSSATASSAAPSTATPARTTAAAPFQAVGALFDGPADDPGAHFCSASVVDSAGGDMIMTAAHCVSDGDGTPARTGMTFAPGYRNGVAPYGYWTVTASVADNGWLTDANPDDDVAFLTVDQLGSAPVQQVTGAYRVDFGGSAAVAVTAVGYNDDEQSATVVSGTTSAWSPTQLQLAQPGLDDGTSGGPLLADPDDTEIVGVVGGHEEGGDTPQVSYAAALAAPIATMYDQAGGSD